ncbi:MAG: hypothetical protein FJW23_10290 [Acidimicrobiia bacterium]|nr:hypothetical protein [Acidimicrobiia bacterium]
MEIRRGIRSCGFTRGDPDTEEAGGRAAPDTVRLAANTRGGCIVCRVMSGQPLASALPVSGTESATADRLAGLFDAHHQRLYRLTRRRSSGSDEAQDLVQDTLLKGALAIRSVPDGAAREEVWLVRVLVNLRHARWRREAVRRRVMSARPLDSGIERATQESRTIARRLV